MLGEPPYLADGGELRHARYDRVDQALGGNRGPALRPSQEFGATRCTALALADQRVLTPLANIGHQIDPGLRRRPAPSWTVRQFLRWSSVLPDAALKFIGAVS